jgi:two-component system sensor histidine kinase AgrC
MVYRLADLAFCLFGAYLYTEAILVSEGKLLNKEKRAALIVIFGVINFALRQYMVNSQELRITVSYIVLLILSSIFYSSNNFVRVFQSATAYATSGMVSYWATAFVFSLINISVFEVRGTLPFMMMYNGSIAILMIFYISVLKYYYQRKYYHYFNALYSWNKYIAYGLIALLINLYIVAYYYIDSNDLAARFLWIVPITLISFALLYIYTQLLLGSQEQKNKQMAYYINNMKIMAEEISGFKHDVNNLYVSLYGLAKNNQLDILKERVLELSDYEILDQIASTESLVNVVDMGLTNLLAEKMYNASKIGVKLHVEVPYKVESFPITGVDMLRILGVFLDNAIEAAAVSTEKGVYFVILNTNRVFDISVVNSYDYKVNVAIIDEKGFTTKLNSKGIGLSNVDTILKKYEGIEWNTVSEEDCFVQNLTIRKAKV